jgi:hypothetical protein
MSLPHDSVCVRWVQPHSVAWPTVPIATPATAPKTSGRRASGRARASSSTTIAEPRYSRGQRAAAADEETGGHEGQARGAGDHERLEDQPELRDVEVVLALEDREPEQQAAHGRGLAEEAGGPADLLVAVVGGQPAVALLLEDEQADDRQPGAGDQHEVGGSPQGDVLAEEPVPDVVEREAEQGVEAGAGQQHPADRDVPALEEADRGGAGLLVQGHRTREDAAGEDTEEAEEDQVVRGVGQRALVASDADVQRDVPEHAQQRHEQRERGEDGRQGHPRRHTRRLPQPRSDPGEDRGPAGAVEEDEPQQQRGQAEADSGREDHLADRGTSGRTCVSSEQQGPSSRSLRLCNTHDGDIDN